MSRFYVKPEYVKGGRIIVPRGEAHHVIDVMRLGKGDAIVAFDGTGREYSGIIEDVDKERMVVAVKDAKKIKGGKKIYIALGQALPKRAQMDFIVEKATELGVDEIMPVISQRTIVRLDEVRQKKKTGHWQNIAISAAQQCDRSDVPEVRAPARFKDILKEAGDYDLALLASLHPDAVHLRRHIPDFKGKRVLVLIGPEGDFTPQEIDAAKAAGFKLVSFGPRVLRVDTAAIFILSILDYENHNI
jgi:16S rRNA (uracil1498-N3)-methyltransferase